jgi:uncharacterized protein YmfQ (DUF2313 family)
MSPMKITLRELLLVCLLVALAVAWWYERSRTAGLDTNITALQRKNSTLEVQNQILQSAVNATQAIMTAQQTTIPRPRFQTGDSEIDEALQRFEEREKAMKDPTSLECTYPRLTLSDQSDPRLGYRSGSSFRPREQKLRA